MSDKSVIIIGAGLAGLAAGCYARMNGYGAHILEHHRVPGGVAASWRKNSFLFDGGVHFLMGTKPGGAEARLLEELGLDLKDKVVPMRAYGRYIDENKGRRVDLTQDLEKFGLELKAYSGEDAVLIDGLIAAARRLEGQGLGPIGLDRPPELAGIGDKLRDKWSSPRAFRVIKGKYAESVDEFGKDIRDPWLRALLMNLFSPSVPVWHLAMLMAMLAGGELGYLESGCQDLVGSLADRFAALGGEATYGATVAEILVEDGRAAGVRLEDGRVFKAGAVISAADGRETVFGLLGGRYADKRMQKRFSARRLAPSSLTVTLGVGKEFPEEVPFTTVQLMHPISAAGRKFGGMLIRFFNYSPKFAPPGKSVVQVEIEESNFEYWRELHDRERGLYDAEKQRLAVEVVARLDKLYPGLSAKVEVAEVATPYTIWRYTRNHQGAHLAWLPTPEFYKTSIPRTLPGLGRFCMAGQWTMGGGVLPVLCSGRHAVQILCRQDGLGFQPGD